MLKVSVVIPVYNAGRDLKECLDSLAAQTMPSADFKVIAIDDGSTDGSAELLDEMADRHGNFWVLHQAPSGWPGQPRNRGLDLAFGEYVFFCDADDWLGPEALERLHSFATHQRSDIVLGKMIGVGRPVPDALFARTRANVTLENAPLMDSLTPHALFRRAFLAEEGIRFPEGRRRLETHPFMVRSYFAADTISVYADYNCYFHAQRSDSANISSQRPDWPTYFDNLAEAVEVVKDHTDPGPVRDRLLTRWLRVEIVRRFWGHQMWKRNPAENARMFAVAHRTVRDHFGAGVIDQLGRDDQLLARALLEGHFPELKSLAALHAEPPRRCIYQRLIPGRRRWAFRRAVLDSRPARMVRSLRRRTAS